MGTVLTRLRNSNYIISLDDRWDSGLLDRGWVIVPGKFDGLAHSRIKLHYWKLLTIERAEAADLVEAGVVGRRVTTLWSASQASNATYVSDRVW